MIYGKKIWIKNSHFVEGTYGYGLTYEALNLIKNLTKNKKNEVWQKNASKMPLTIINNKMIKGYNKDIYRLTIDYKEDLIVFKKIILKLKNRFYKIKFYDLLELYKKMNLFIINGKRNIDYNERILKQSIK